MRTVGGLALLWGLGLAWVVGAQPAGDDPLADWLASRGMDQLHAQCAFGPRNPGSSGHARCLDFLRSQLEASGGRVTLQSFRHVAPGLREAVQLTNLLARFGPPRSGGLLLGAHWDTRPWADYDPDPSRRDEPILGANDGGSGTGLLLALGEAFARRPPPIPVLLVLFDGEDLGREGHAEEYCAGSRYFANHLPGPFPEAALVVDMVASESMVLTVEEFGRQRFPEMAQLVDRLASELGLLQYQPGYGPALIDDHVPLIEAGLPTLLLVDFRDPRWHTHGDRPEACAETSLAQTARIVEQLIYGGYFH